MSRPFVKVVASSGVPPGAVRTVPVGEAEVVVWRTVEGQAVVVDVRCPHQWSHLGYEGAVDGCELVCVTHWWRFDADGRGTKLNVKGRRDPKGDLEVFPSREHDGWVEADLSRLPGASATTSA